MCVSVPTKWLFTDMPSCDGQSQYSHGIAPSFTPYRCHPIPSVDQHMILESFCSLFMTEQTNNVRIWSCHAFHRLLNGCGLQVVLDRKDRIFTWGFGGYGRLGHDENKDELVPRLLKFFDGPNRGAVMIAAGSTFSITVNKLGELTTLPQDVSKRPFCIGWNIEPKNALQ